MNNNSGNENRNNNIGKGNYNENIRGNYYDNRKYYGSPSKKNSQSIKYLPRVGTTKFVGRENELVKIHSELHGKNNAVPISVISGMGGMGKTELAIQYARRYYDDYSGGICWLDARGENLATGIVQFVQQRMGLPVPENIEGNGLTPNQQVAWCWQNWQPSEGSVLVILDDVTEYQNIKQLLPKTNNQRFKLLITTRLRHLDPNFTDVSLDVLSEEKALSLLKLILGKQHRRIDNEVQTAKNLCQRLGYLPLALELVGRHLLEDPDLSIAGVLQNLIAQRRNQVINPTTDRLKGTEITAKFGVEDAFNLTWEKLDPQARKVGELLSLFDPTVIAWKYVESVSESLNWNKTDVNEAKKQLHKRHLIEKLEKEEEASYKIHPLIREFLQTKLNHLEHKGDYTQSFCANFIEIGKTIPYTTTLEIISGVKNAIPHLTEVAKHHLDAVRDENLYPVFIGLGKFYQGQGLYALAEPWYEKYIEVVKSRYGENSSNYATSLNWLANLYYSQGKYDKAEPLYTQALKLHEQLSGENDSNYAGCLNLLALLYKSQGKYDQAEPLYTQALELRKRILGENHPSTATSLNNLANLYKSQGKYDQAEPLYTQALELRKRILGENHPDTAQSLNNLANLYYNQKRYEEAEPLYIQALEIAKQVFGSDHSKTQMYKQNLENVRAKQQKASVQQQQNQTSEDDSLLGKFIRWFLG